MARGGAPDRMGDVASAGLRLLDRHLAIFGFRPTPAHIEATWSPASAGWAPGTPAEPEAKP